VFVPLSSLTTVPSGTVIDATNGTVELTSVPEPNGHVSTGLFSGGIFRVTRISARVNGRTVVLTVLTLVGPLPTCPRAHKATVARHAHVTARRLWGDAKCNFRTVGRYAAATVRGTKWLTEDTCTGTLVRVVRGIVSVEDLPHHRTVLVKAGHSIRAHPGRGG
jgi:hypothetical protein